MVNIQMALLSWVNRKLNTRKVQADELVRREALWSELECLISRVPAAEKVSPEFLSAYEEETQEIIREILADTRPLETNLRESLKLLVAGRDADQCEYAKGKLWEWLKKPLLAERAYRACLAENRSHARANNQLGLLLLKKEMWDEAIACFGCALEGEPNNAIFHNNLGRALWLAGETNDALECYRNAWLISPNIHVVRSNLFSLALELGQTEIASEVVTMALASDVAAVGATSVPELAHNTPVSDFVSFWPRTAEADLAINLGDFDRAGRLFSALDDLYPLASHTGLGNIALIQGDFLSAEEHFSAAAKLSPGNPIVLQNLAVATIHLGKYDDGLTIIENGLQLDKNNSDLLFMKSGILLKKGCWKAGWEVHDARFGLAAFHDSTRDFVDVPKWSGEALTGKCLALVGEQGAGDQIQFVRYAEALAQLGAEVVVHCDAPLKRLFKTVPGVAGVCTELGPLDVFDYLISMLSVPGIVGCDEASIPAVVPYLFPDETACRYWATRLSHHQGLRVGLAWAGSPHLAGKSSLRDRRRSLPLAALAPLWEFGGISYFSLQKGPPRSQLKDFAADHPITDWSEEWVDFADTAAFISALDLVISVDTSVAHLAGALGKPVWILSRFDGCWRWLDGRDDSPWYPSAKIFHQMIPGEWEQVVAQVASLLRQHH